MPVKTFLIKAEETALDALKSAGTIIEHIVITDTQAFVAEVKQLPIATLAMNLIEALMSHSLTGAQKMASVIGMLKPAVQAYKDAGGLQGLATSVEHIAEEAGQSLFTDVENALAKVAGGAA